VGNGQGDCTATLKEEIGLEGWLDPSREVRSVRATNKGTTKLRAGPVDGVCLNWPLFLPSWPASQYSLFPSLHISPSLLPFKWPLRPSTAHILLVQQLLAVAIDTTTETYLDRDPQFTYSQDYSVEEDDESDDGDVFAFRPPSTAEQPPPPEPLSYITTLLSPATHRHMNTHSTSPPTPRLQHPLPLPSPPLRILLFIHHQPLFLPTPLTIYQRLVHLPPQSTLLAQLIPLLPPPQPNTMTLCQLKVVSVSAGWGTCLPLSLPPLVSHLPVPKFPQNISVVVLYSRRSGSHPPHCRTSLPLTLNSTAHL
jgi:hypothetical protein